MKSGTIGKSHVAIIALLAVVAFLTALFIVPPPRKALADDPEWVNTDCCGANSVCSWLAVALDDDVEVGDEANCCPIWDGHYMTLYNPASVQSPQNWDDPVWYGYATTTYGADDYAIEIWVTCYDDDGPPIDGLWYLEYIMYKWDDLNQEWDYFGGAAHTQYYSDDCETVEFHIDPNGDCEECENIHITVDLDYWCSL